MTSPELPQIPRQTSVPQLVRHSSASSMGSFSSPPKQGGIDALIEDLYPGTPRTTELKFGGSRTSGDFSSSSPGEGPGQKVSLNEIRLTSPPPDGATAPAPPSGAFPRTAGGGSGLPSSVCNPPPSVNDFSFDDAPHKSNSSKLITSPARPAPVPPRKKIVKTPAPEGTWTWPLFNRSALAPPAGLETDGSEQICIVNTGGTFSCLRDENDKLSPSPLFPYLRTMEAFKNGRLVDEKSLAPGGAHYQENDGAEGSFPKYVLVEHEMLMIDSTNITANEWNLMSMVIASRRDHYKAFVIIHGTDTMSYTGSVLTFALPSLMKPIVVTGSQNPLRYVREGVPGHTDAANNLLGAVQYADHPKSINTVVIYFHSKIILGTRAVKQNATDYNAFTSPNVGVLGYFNGEFRINEDLAEHVNQMDTVNRVKLNPPPKFGMLPFFLRARVLLYQTMPAAMPREAHLPLKCMLASLIEDKTIPVAVITLGYGAGNGQPEVAEYLKEIREKHHIPCCWTTQCFAGTAQGNYAVGLGSDQGVNVWDMTPECAYVRMMHTLSQRLFVSDFKRNENFRNLVEDIMSQPEKLCFTPPNPKSDVMRALFNSAVSLYQ